MNASVQRFEELRAEVKRTNPRLSDQTAVTIALLEELAERLPGESLWTCRVIEHLQVLEARGRGAIVLR